MSADQQMSQESSTRERLVERLDTLEAELEAERNARQRVEAENEALRERIDDLESKFEGTREAVWELEGFVLGDYNLEFLDDDTDLLSRLENLNDRVGSLDTTMSELAGQADAIDDVQAELRAEQQTRSQADSQIRARLTLVQDAIDADVDESRLVEQDKLARIIKNGVQDVVSSPSARQERAEDILLRMSDWGTRQSDQNGDRVVFYAKDVRDHMRDRYGTSTIQSTQVQRAFDALVEFAADSPRRVKKRKNDGRVQLVVFEPESLLDAAAGVSR